MKILTPGTVEIVILSPAPVSTHVVKRADRAVLQLRRAFEFGYRDHPEHFNPARAFPSSN